MRKTFLKVGISLLVTGIVIGLLSIWGMMMLSIWSPVLSYRVHLSLGLIPAVLLIASGLICTSLSLIFVLRAKRTAAKYKPQLEAEGIIFFEERIGGSMTFRNFHRSGAYTSWQKMGISALLALTQKRLIALKGSKPIIDVFLTDERLKQMKFSLEGEDKLCIAFDANLFQPDWSGEIEYHFQTPNAKKILRKINAAMQSDSAVPFGESSEAIWENTPETDEPDSAKLPSRLGIASTVIGGGLPILVTILLISSISLEYLDHKTRTEFFHSLSNNFFDVLFIVGIYLAAPLHSIGSILGLSGIFSERTKKTFSVAGIILNLLFGFTSVVLNFLFFALTLAPLHF